MLNLSVCIGSACHIKGSYNVISTFQQLVEAKGLTDKVEISAIFCLGHCTEAVSVRIGADEIFSVSGLTAKQFFEDEVMKRISA